MSTAFIKSILRIFIVVSDAEAAARGYETSYGIGPWVFQDFGDTAVPEKKVRGIECAYQMKLATCDALNVGLGLIQPLDSRSIFAEFLAKNGPGIHHLLVMTADGFQAAIDWTSSRGGAVLQQGRTANGIEYAHLDLTQDLGLILETFKLPE